VFTLEFLLSIPAPINFVGGAQSVGCQSAFGFILIQR